MQSVPSYGSLFTSSSRCTPPSAGQTTADPSEAVSTQSSRCAGRSTTGYHFAPGNIDLKPEETVTYNAGLIARPFDAWQVTLDYWRIVFDDRMAPQSFQRVVDAENSITGAIFLQEGCSTRLIAAAEDLSSYGIDLRGLGDLRLNFSGSHIIQYVISGDNSRDVSGKLNRSSFARPLSKFKFNVQAAWARDQHRAFLTWRHISPYENDSTDRLLNPHCPDDLVI